MVPKFIKRGYFHIPITEKVRFKIAFILPWAKYYWQRLSLGLVGALFTFAEDLSLILGDLDFVVVFYDDIFIFSETPVGEFSTSWVSA